MRSSSFRRVRVKGCPNNIPFTKTTLCLRSSLRQRHHCPARSGLGPARGGGAHATHPPSIDFSFDGLSIVCYELSFGDVSPPLSHHPSHRPSSLNADCTTQARRILPPCHPHDSFFFNPKYPNRFLPLLAAKRIELLLIYTYVKC